MAKWTVVTLKEWIDENIVKKVDRLHQWAFGNGAGSGIEKRVARLEKIVDSTGNCRVGRDFRKYEQEQKEMKTDNNVKKEMRIMIVSNVLVFAGIVVTVILQFI
jgi:hypothetical protein